MRFKLIHIAETVSTNLWLKEHASNDEVAVWADYQTAGRGCGTNQWESERGQNLLFSLLMKHDHLNVKDQFILSMALSLGIHDSIAHLLMTTYGEAMANKLTIKWPNDIYWNDSKLCGILIENLISGSLIRQSIMGVGLNVNQTAFFSDAPNPISLKQMMGQSFNRQSLLEAILNAFEARMNAYNESLHPQSAFCDLRFDYVKRLYRSQGFYLYCDRVGEFEAEFETIDDDGALILRDRNGRLRRYAFKEVHFLI